MTAPSLARDPTLLPVLGEGERTVGAGEAPSWGCTALRTGLLTG